MAQTEQKNQNVKKQFEELQSLLERAMALQTSMVLFEWDDETLAPKGAAEHTARVIGSLSEQYQEILASMRFKELLDACQKAEKENAGVFDEVQSAILREAAEEQERLSCIPPDCTLFTNSLSISSIQCFASSLPSGEFKYLAGMITSVSTLSPYLNTCPFAFISISSCDLSCYFIPIHETAPAIAGNLSPNHNIRL